MDKSKGEIISNAIINGLSLPISIVMMIILIINYNNVLGLLFSIFISVGILTTSIFKTLYYSLDSGLFKKFSYMSFITTLTLLLINLCLSNISVISWIVFGISIGLLIINIIFECINIDWFKYINFVCNLSLLVGFIIMGLLFSINVLIYIFILSLLVVIFIFYYLYELNVIIHYLLSIAILLLNIFVLLFLYI